MIHERAHAKLNLVLHVGRPRGDGLHPICSLFASIELADAIQLCESETGAEAIICPGVEGPNLAAAALAAFRRAGGELAPLRIEIAKRIPVSAGLGGGSADAAAVLRGANRLAGHPIDSDGLLAIAAGIGSDVPSRLRPGHALVTGVGELVEPVRLPALIAVLVPAEPGLSAGTVYSELDRIEGWREELDPAPLLELASGAPEDLAAALENDLEAAALSLRPELERPLAELRSAGAVRATISGSGPTAFALFRDRMAAEAAAAPLPGALVTALHSAAAQA